MSAHNDKVEVAGTDVPRPITLQGERLAFRKVCWLVHNGEVEADLDWPDTMTLQEFLPLADAALRFGSSNPSSFPIPHPPTAASTSAHGHGSGSGSADVRAADQPAESPRGSAMSRQGSFRTALVRQSSSHSAGASPKVHRSPRGATGKVLAGDDHLHRPFDVRRGGMWHLAMASPANAAARASWIGEVWKDLPRTASPSTVLAVDLVPFLERNAAQSIGEDAEDLSEDSRVYALMCRCVARHCGSVSPCGSSYTSPPCAHRVSPQVYSDGCRCVGGPGLAG